MSKGQVTQISLSRTSPKPLVLRVLKAPSHATCSNYEVMTLTRVSSTVSAKECSRARAGCTARPQLWHPLANVFEAFSELLSTKTHCIVQHFARLDPARSQDASTAVACSLNMITWCCAVRGLKHCMQHERMKCPALPCHCSPTNIGA